jgi:hypothetical protein
MGTQNEGFVVSAHSRVDFELTSHIVHLFSLYHKTQRRASVNSPIFHRCAQRAVLGKFTELRATKKPPLSCGKRRGSAYASLLIGERLG